MTVWRWRMLFVVAALLVFVTLLMASHARPLTFVVTPGDRYGVRLDRGQLQFMHGQQLTLERHADGTAGERKIGWNDENEYWRSLTRLTDAERDPTRLRVTLDAWRPFIQPASASVETQLLWPYKLPDGTVRTKVIRVGRMITFVGTSLWPAFVVAVVALGAWQIRRIRRRCFLPAIACPACGYDLRASPERCPECGQQTPALIQS